MEWNPSPACASNAITRHFQATAFPAASERRESAYRHCKTVYDELEKEIHQLAVMIGDSEENFLENTLVVKGITDQLKVCDSAMIRMEEAEKEVEVEESNFLGLQIDRVRIPKTNAFD